MSERPRAAWLGRFDEYDVPAGPVNEYDDVFDDPHLQARGLFDAIDVEENDRSDESVHQVNHPLQFERSAPVEKSPAPHHGAHTTDLLSEVGYSDAEIATLLETGAVVERPER